MANRRFGPTRGAGTVIQEQSGDKQINPGALGWAGYAAIFEKGPVGELVVASNKKIFNKKMGSSIPGSLGPDAAEDYYDVANGAGGLLLVRITDGNELPASANLYSRKSTVNGGRAVMGKIEAKNGGRWGGRAARAAGAVSSLADITATTLTTGNTSWTTDQWKGGYVELPDVANKRYPIVGNTAAGVITVASDQTMRTDMGAGTGLNYYLVLDDIESKRVTFLISDGEDNPDTEFSLSTFVDGNPVKKYPNLNTDPGSPRYWVNIINNDDGNDEIFVTNLFTGTHTASVRPANDFGIISAVTANTLTKTILTTLVSSSGGGNPTAAVGVTNDEHVAQIITVTMSSATAGTAVSDKFGSLGAVTLGTPFVSTNKWVPPFTITAGSNPLASGNTVALHYQPFRANELVGGYVYPDKTNAKREKYRIVSNTHKTLTIAAGGDLTLSGAIDDLFLIENPTRLTGGRDGIADVVDSDYEDLAWDVSDSPFNRVEDKNFGLIKFATPGVTSVAVQKAGKNYAEAKNHQYRYEIPSNVVSETGALAFIDETVGRSDYAVSSFPSFGYVTDPDRAAAREGKLKLVSSTGQIHGREARIAVDYDGYHKAAAGVDATLPRILKLPTGDAILNEELLNPAGISVIKKKRGNYVIWGDRTLCVDSEWKFKHQREQMSYYEQVLRENFDFIIFSINDPDNDAVARNAIRLFFMPEFVKRALRGETFDDACVVKVDSENNTDATRSTGDQYADVQLRLADTVERFNIRISKMGVFSTVV